MTIINPAAGADTPILSELNQATNSHHIANEILVTQNHSDLKRFAQKAIKLKPDAVMVHGGDGTIVEVAKFLYKTEIPLIIVPGGTANVIAKELEIPLNTVEALKVLGRKPKVRKLNVASFGHKEMFLRVEVGILAKMVKEATSELKSKLGILAYPFVAFKEAAAAVPSLYSLTLDGQKRQIEGVGLMVANVGNIGVPGFSIHSHVNCSDGLLDVFVLRSSDLSTLLAVGSSALIGTPKPLKLKHWQVKKVTVSVSPKQPIICDDAPVHVGQFTVAIKSANLTVLL